MRFGGKQIVTSEVSEIILMTESFELREGAAPKTAVTLLAEQAKAGDIAAFEQLIVCYQRKVVATAWRLLGNEEDAKDAAQETFLKAYKYLKSFDARQDFSGWLYRITVNACHDLARKRQSKEQFSSFEAEQEAGRFDHLRSREDIEAATIAAQERGLITEALQTLTKKERAALVLRDLEGLPTDEVAKILGSSQTTVRSQVSMARTKIKAFRDRVLSRRKSL